MAEVAREEVTIFFEHSKDFVGENDYPRHFDRLGVSENRLHGSCK